MRAGCAVAGAACGRSPLLGSPCHGFPAAPIRQIIVKAYHRFFYYIDERTNTVLWSMSQRNAQIPAHPALPAAQRTARSADLSHLAGTLPTAPFRPVARTQVQPLSRPS